MLRFETTANSVSAFHGVGGELRAVVSLEHTQGCIRLSHSPPLRQLVWLLLHTLMILGAVRLTFRVTPEGRYRLLAGRHPTLSPSPHLQRLGPEIAVWLDVPFAMQCRYRMALIHLLKLPLLWFSKERPSAVLSPFASGLCPHLCKETDNRCLTAKSNTPSVRAVPPGYDGLLRKWLCRCIAPYFQPWGSSRFQHNLPFTALLQRLVPRAFPRLAYRTLRSFSLRDSRTVSPQPLPSRRCLLPLFPVNACSTARRCSIAKSVSR